MNQDNTLPPASQQLPLFKLVGIVALITGIFALIFAIVRFNSDVSLALRHTSDGDPLFWLMLIGGVFSTLYGVATALGGYNLFQILATKTLQILATKPPKTLAINSLICGLLGCFLPLGIFVVIFGIVCGHTARFKIRKDRSLTGNGLALAALCLCYLVLFLGFFAFIVGLIRK